MIGQQRAVRSPWVIGLAAACLALLGYMALRAHLVRSFTNDPVPRRMCEAWLAAFAAGDRKAAVEATGRVRIAQTTDVVWHELLAKTGGGQHLGSGQG
jgi:hypothetical protein